VTLLHLPLFRLHRLVDIEGVLFRSPFILRLLGLNARQIAQGFSATSGPRPFTAEALGDFFAEVPPETLLEQQLVLLGHLQQQFPAMFGQGVYAMDCMTVAAPPGRLGLPAARFILCILSVHLGPTALPILGSYAPEVGEGTGDISLGRTLVARARDVLTPADLSLLLIDRGFLDGAWLAEQARLGTDIIIGLKEDLLAYADLVGLSRLADTVWEDVPPPKNHRAPPPVRQVALFPPIDSISAAPKLLGQLNLQDKIVLGDALHAQRALSQQIKHVGGDFIWLIKANQPLVLEEIAELFAPEMPPVLGNLLPNDFVSYEQTDKEHGRRERRRLTVSSALKGYTAWPSLEQMFRLERWRTDLKTGASEADVVYGLTSLSR